MFPRLAVWCDGIRVWVCVALQPYSDAGPTPPPPQAHHTRTVLLWVPDASAGTGGVDCEVPAWDNVQWLSQHIHTDSA